MEEQAERDVEVIRRMMDAQAEYDWAALDEILADDAVFEMPFIKQKFSGRTKIIARWRPALERMDGVRFYDVKLRAMAEPGWYIGTYRNTCTLSTTGLPYDQMYIGEFHVLGGQIAYFCEYFDTVRLDTAMRRIEKIAG